jgi:hypothetical protein
MKSNIQLMEATLKGFLVTVVTQLFSYKAKFVIIPRKTVDIHHAIESNAETDFFLTLVIGK